MSENQEPIPLLCIDPQKIQAIVQELLGHGLDELEMKQVISHLQALLNNQIEWLPLLKQCIEEIVLRAEYTVWLKQVDEAVWNMAGCSVEDLPDFDYFSLFMVGSTPEQAADAVLLSAGFRRFG